MKRTIILDEQTQANINEWFAIHEKRMNELGAIPIPKKLFDNAFKNLIPKEKAKFLFAFHEKKMISDALLHNRWHKGKTAKMLGIPRRTLQRKMAKYEF